MTDTFLIPAQEPQASPELEQVRATVQALQGAATLLQGAIEQRHGLWAEVREAEQALARLQQQRAEAEQALVAAQTHLERTTRTVEQVRSEQQGVVAEFDRLVQSALARRADLINEISTLELRRDELAPAAPVVEEATASVVPMWDPFAVEEPTPPAVAPVVVPITVEVMAPIVNVEPVVAVEPVATAVEAHAQSPAPLGKTETRRGLPLRGMRTAFQALLGATLVALAVLLTPVSQLAGGMQLLAVMSGSMEPTIQVGGIVGVLPVQTSLLQVGDVITFANANNPDVLITHRIVDLEPNGNQTMITTKGDANDTVDAVTASSNRTVGRVAFTLPWLGYLMVWLASPIAKIAILAAAVLGFALPSLKRSAPAPRKTDSYLALEREIEALLPSQAAS